METTSWWKQNGRRGAWCTLTVEVGVCRSIHCVTCSDLLLLSLPALGSCAEQINNGKGHGEPNRQRWAQMPYNVVMEYAAVVLFILVLLAIFVYGFDLLLIQQWSMAHAVVLQKRNLTTEC
jgi:hypothetical protein